MKVKSLLWLFIAVVFFMAACDKEEDEAPPVVEGDGTVEFRMTVWNQTPGGSKALGFDESKSDVHTLNIIDARQLLTKVEVTTDDIASGVPSGTINWVTLFTSDTEKLATGRNVTLEIPSGTYTGFRVTQRNLMYWVCMHENAIIELPDKNISVMPDEALLTNYFGLDGLYEIQDGAFALANANEKLGSFKIEPNKTTRITIRINLKTIDWHDNDSSGTWTDGDQVSNRTLPDGVTSMMDLLVQ